MANVYNDRPRRGNGDGSVTKRSNGKYMGQIMIGRDHTGRRIIKTVYADTAKEVKQKLTNLKADIYSNRYFEPSKITVKDWLFQWLNVYKTRSSRVQTRDLYKTLIKSIIIPFMGGTKLLDVKPMMIQELINKMVDDGYSFSTVEKIKNILNPAFNIAAINKLIPESPFIQIQLPTKSEKDIVAFTRKEQSAFMRHSEGSHFYEYYMIALNSGARCGELLALKWNDVDFKKNRIHITKTLVKENVDGKEILTIQNMPKTKKSNRWIPIPEKYMELIKEMKEARELKGFDDNNIVFCNRVGKLIYPKNIIRSMHSICDKANIRKASTHVLRHTYATRLFEEKVDIKTVSELLGHAKINITYNEYIHVFSTQKNESVEVLNNLNLDDENDET